MSKNSVKFRIVIEKELPNERAPHLPTRAIPNKKKMYKRKPKYPADWLNDEEVRYVHR